MSNNSRIFAAASRGVLCFLCGSLLLLFRPAVKRVCSGILSRGRLPYGCISAVRVRGVDLYRQKEKKKLGVRTRIKKTIINCFPERLRAVESKQINLRQTPSKHRHRRNTWTTRLANAYGVKRYALVLAGEMGRKDSIKVDFFAVELRV